MTPFPLQTRDKDAKQTAQDPSELRVGHVYLDVRRRRVLCLNQAARDLYADGVPLVPADLESRPLQDVQGDPVTSKQLPLTIAWRTHKPAEAHFVVPRGDNPPWRIAWTATPLHDGDGHLLGVLGTITCGAAEVNERLMAELAHDLRTPLQSLRLLCALVERMPGADGEMKKALEAIRAVSERAVQIALDLLEACRGPVPKIGVEEAPWLPLEPLLSGLAAEQALAAEEKGLALTGEFSAVAGWEIQSDRARLGRLLSNLLVNAVRYTPKGRVHFRAHWRGEGDNRVLDISVVDTGPGISEEETESIFQPYERGKAGRKAGDSSGSGLGLAVVDRLVDELGLSLDVYSEYGRGSAFHLQVPLFKLRQNPPKP